MMRSKGLLGSLHIPVSQEQLKSMLFRLVQGIQIREKLFFVRGDQVFVESFVYIFENDGHPEVPARFLAAVKAGCFGFDADDIAFFLSFFQQGIMIGFPKLDKFLGITPFYTIIAFDSERLRGLCGRMQGNEGDGCQKDSGA